MFRSTFALTSLLAFVSLAPADAKNDIEFKSDDMIVWVGNTFVERAPSYGHIETAISLAVGPKVNGLKFRNLGWSGDSTTNESRAYFGPPTEGQERLVKGISELKPNLLFLTYGTVEAMNGADEIALGEYEKGISRIIKDLKAAAGPQLRSVVLVTPPPLENLGGLLPDQSENNQALAKFVESTKRVAKSSKSSFVDLFGAMGGHNFSGDVPEAPLTENGVHYTDQGYSEVAHYLTIAMGLQPVKNEQNAIQDIDQFRELVIEKNRLFFHRWRPVNETYLFLFRKHEQGQNAKEIPMFDPLIAKKEKSIEEKRSEIFKKITPR